MDCPLFTLLSGNVVIRQSRRKRLRNGFG
jgi:hypothetical protein